MGEVVKLIDYLEDKQRTPSEVLDYMKDEIAAGNASHILILFKGKEKAFWLAGSDERNYKSSEIMWEVLQFQKHFI